MKNTCSTGPVHGLSASGPMANARIVLDNNRISGQQIIFFLFSPENRVWYFSRIVPASILYKSIAGRYRPVSYPDGPITARYRFKKECLLGSP